MVFLFIYYCFIIIFIIVLGQFIDNRILAMTPREFMGLSSPMPVDLELGICVAAQILDRAIPM